MAQRPKGFLHDERDRMGRRKRMSEKGFAKTSKKTENDLLRKSAVKAYLKGCIELCLPLLLENK
jgi:hypothetical protein